jgi:hypothetical protein
MEAIAIFRCDYVNIVNNLKPPIVTIRWSLQMMWVLSNYVNPTTSRDNISQGILSLE